MATEEAGLELNVEGEDDFSSALEKANAALASLNEAAATIADTLAESSEAFDTADEAMTGLGEGAQESAEGIDDSAESLDDADEALVEFTDSADEAGSSFDAASEIIIGGLRKIGEIAVESFLSAGAAFGDFVADSFAGALDAEKVMARLNAQIKAQGSSAAVTAEQAGELADQYKHLAGGSDDAILSAEAVLLKFNQISGETFPQTIKVSADLAALMGTDVASAAQTLGFALETGGDGLARIAKQTGAFTDEELKNIKAMQEAGDIAGAQKAILNNLEDAIGGTADALASTTAGQWQIFQETISDAGEGIAGALLPAISQLVNGLKPVLFVVEDLAGAFSTFITAFSETGDITEALDSLMEFDSVRAIFSALGVSGKDFYTNSALIGDAFEYISNSAGIALSSIGDFVNNTFIPAIKSIGDSAGVTLPTAQEVFEGVMNGIVTASQLVSDFIVNTLVPGMTVAVDWVVANWPAIQATIEEVVNAIQTVITTVLAEVIPFAVSEFEKIKAWTDENWPLIQQTIDTVINAISGIVESVTGAIASFWEEHGETLKSLAKTFWENIKISIDNNINAILGIIKAVMQLINGDWEGAWNTVKATAETIWEGINTQIDNAVNALWPIIDAAIQIIKSGWESVWTSISSFVSEKMEEVRKAIDEKINAAKTAFENAVKAIKTAVEDNVTAAATAFSNAIDSIKKAAEPAGNYINSLLDSFKNFYNWLNTHVFSFKIELPDLPDWAIPGSPTPFEIGLRGIDKALREVVPEAVNFAHSIEMIPTDNPITPPSSASQIAQQSVYNNSSSNSITINAQYPMQSARSVSDDLQMWTMLTGNSAA